MFKETFDLPPRCRRGMLRGSKVAYLPPVRAKKKSRYVQTLQFVLVRQNNFLFVLSQVVHEFLFMGQRLARHPRQSREFKIR